MLYDAESGNLTLTVAGDTILTRRLSVFTEERFTSLLDLFRKADVSFTNLEMLIHQYEHSPGISGGHYTAADPSSLEELKWAGINLVSCANNHSYDYGEGGVVTHLQHLEASGLVHAGMGRHLSEAQAPGYLDTANGRVALISLSSTFAEPGQALDQRPDMKGRPGLNPLRHKTTYTVDQAAFDQLRRMREGLGLEAKEAAVKKIWSSGRRAPKHLNRLLSFRGQKAVARRLLSAARAGDNIGASLHFLDGKFVLGRGFLVTTKPDQSDMEGNLKAVRDARRMADWVLVSVHCHESGSVLEEAPEFFQTFARSCVDEGAVAVIGHGPHILRGIEIYRHRPIFYSLGNFIFQYDTTRRLPSCQYEDAGLGHSATPADFEEAYSQGDTIGFPSNPVFWQSVVAECEYSGGELCHIRLHPIDLGFGRPRYQRGRPLLASVEHGNRILERLKRISDPLGTSIEIENNTGLIRLRCASQGRAVRRTETSRRR